MTEPINLPWPKRELWTVSEAACLLCGVDPVAEKAEFEKKKSTDPNLAVIYREVKDATIKGTLEAITPVVFGWIGQRRVDPKKCLAWAISKGLGVPELLREMQEMLPAPAGFEFDSDDSSYPEELDIALIAWRAVTKSPQPNRPPKDQIRDWLEKRNPHLTNEARDRIATICNWDKKGGRPKS